MLLFLDVGNTGLVKSVFNFHLKHSYHVKIYSLVLPQERKKLHRIYSNIQCNLVLH